MEIKDCRLLVTPTSYGKNDPRLRAELTEKCAEVIFNDTGKPLKAAEVARLLPGIDGYIAGVDEINAQAIAAADRLKVISRYGVGVDNVDLRAARERGIVVTNTPGANSVSVAELTLGLMLSLARHIPAAAEATRLGEWPRITGVSIKGKTVGIIGLGAVGREVARRLAGFECRVLATDPHMDAALARQLDVEPTDLQDLLARADFVSLHAPVTPETRNMVNDRFIGAMKPGAFLINCARGELVDEEALLRALRSGRVRGAALDVFVQEPPAPDNPLLHHPNVTVMPHSGSHADDAMNAMGRMAMADCLDVLAGREPKHRVA